MNESITSDPRPRLVRTTLGLVALAEEGEPGAPALFCLHGLPGSVRDFRYLGPRLAGHFRVLRVDLPGFGASPPGVVRSVAGWSRVPAALADALGLGRFLIMSHSFGGGAALRASVEQPSRVRGIVLLASNGPRRHRAWGLPPQVFGGLSRALELPWLRERLFAWGRTQFAALSLPAPVDVEELALWLRVMSSHRFELIGRWAAATRVPAIVAYARDDRLIDLPIARSLAALIPQARVLELESGGHHLQKTRAAEIADAVVESFATSYTSAP